MTCGRLSREYFYHLAVVLMFRKFPAPEWDTFGSVVDFKLSG